MFRLRLQGAKMLRIAIQYYLYNLSNFKYTEKIHSFVALNTVIVMLFLQ